MKTLERGFAELKTALKDGGIEDFAFEAACLFREAAGADRQDLICRGGLPLAPEKEKLLRSLLSRRLSGEPLQYLIGSWDFCDLTFEVGEGAFIPRSETEILAELADDFLKKRPAAVVFDLCAGVGSLGLTAANHNPACRVFLFEKEDAALAYLRRNRELLAPRNTGLFKWDVLTGPPDGLPHPDLLLCNPPYVPAGELPYLQREVRREPRAALDGGADGLRFYRAVRKLWLPLLKSGGNLIFECGNGQAEAVAGLFSGCSSEQKISFDYNRIDRTVQIIV